MLTIILILIFILVFASILVYSKKIKKKAMNTKIKATQNEVIKSNDKTLSKEKIIEEKIDSNTISVDRINTIKEKFKATQNIDIIEKEATKEDIDNFYRSQMDNVDLNKKLDQKSK